jgi:class 3 adenylate cyclase
MVPEAEWIEAGLLDPASPTAGERRALLEWLTARGLTVEELVEADAEGNLHSSFADRKLRPAPTMSREDVSARTGLSVEDVDRAWLAAGFPPAPPGEVVFNEDDLLLFDVVPAAMAMFGPDTLLAFTRVMGAAMARIAEAADAMFLTDVEAPRRAGGVTELELAQMVDEGVTMLAGLPTLLVPLFRRHAAAAIDRSRLNRSGQRGTSFVGSYNVPLAVGFADLVGFTALAERTEPRALAAIVGRFERSAAERAVAAGVRLVKSIGDAVMIVGSDPVAVVDVVAGLAAEVDAEPALSGMRGAVVAGDVLVRDGDYVGPTVNLAARATKEAPPGGVVVNSPVADALATVGRASTPMPPVTLRGIDEPVALALVTPAPA